MIQMPVGAFVDHDLLSHLAGSPDTDSVIGNLDDNPVLLLHARALSGAIGLDLARMAIWNIAFPTTAHQREHPNKLAVDPGDMFGSGAIRQRTGPQTYSWK